MSMERDLLRKKILETRPGLQRQGFGDRSTKDWHFAAPPRLDKLV